MRPSFAIILTHNRPELLAECVAAIAPQVGLVLVIDNASDPPAEMAPWDHHTRIVYDDEQPPNLGRLWNVGFDYIESACVDADEWDVAVLCDDADVPPDWFRTVADGMREHGAAIGCTHQINPTSAPILKTEPDSDIINRMPGWAWVCAGEKQLRAHEGLKWWWVDTDMDWRARAAGGMVVLPGPVVVNKKPNDFTGSVPGLGEQAGRDGELFAEIHGWRPW